MLRDTSRPLPRVLRALAHRNYRLYFTGQVISLAGTWMQQIAVSWLAWQLSGSPLVLGVVAFSGQIPILLLGPFGGLWSDHFDRRRILIVTQSLAMLQAVLLAWLTFSGQVQVWHLELLALFLGAVNAVDVPARQALAVHLVDDRPDLPNAIALNSFTMNAARLIGPSIAGATVALVGEAWCFMLNALSYLAVLLALTAMKVTQEVQQRQPTVQALREGFAYALGTPWIRHILFLAASLSFFITSYATLMPAVVQHTYAEGAHTYGLLMACAGAGALAGTIFLASRHEAADLGRLVAITAPLTGASLVVFALSRSFWLAVPALMLIGFGMIASIAASNTRLQTGVRNELRGRVLSLFSMAFLGIAPLGSLAAGALAGLASTKATLLAFGAISCLLTLVLTRRNPEAARAQE